MVKTIKLFQDLKVFFELKKVINKMSPDIIHLHSSKAGVLGRLVSLFHHKRIIYTVHGFDSIRVKHRKFLPLEKFLQRFCGAIVAVSNYDKNNLVSEKITKNVSSVYNDISESNITPINQLQGFNKKRKTILTIARIAPPNNLELFLKTAKELPQYDFLWLEFLF